MNIIEGPFAKPGVVVDMHAADTATAVEYLEGAIELAKTNGAICCAVIMITRDGAVVDGWSAADSMRPYVMIGALEMLKHRYAQTNIEGF